MSPTKQRRSRTRLPGTLALLGLLAGATLAPGRAEAQAPRPKNPSTARAIAFFAPGGGHLYAGETAKGLFLLAASAGAATAGFLTSDVYGWDYTCQTSNCMDPNAGPNHTKLYIGLGVAGAVWLYSLIDAPNAARRANQRGPLGPVSMSPFTDLRSGSVRPGLAVRVAF